MTSTRSEVPLPLAADMPADLAVTPADVHDVAATVWQAFLGMDLQPADAPAPRGGMTGVVAVTGAWRGAVVLQCTQEHAVRAAEAMFAAEPGSLGQEEVADALGELTNMVGGNLKNLLPEPSVLSIPSVTGGADAQVFVSGAKPVLEVPLRSGEDLLRVTVWQS